MTSNDNNFNYFSQKQLTKLTACTQNNNSKQERWNKLKSGGINNM